MTLNWWEGLQFCVFRIDEAPIFQHLNTPDRVLDNIVSAIDDRDSSLAFSMCAGVSSVLATISTAFDIAGHHSQSTSA